MKTLMLPLMVVRRLEILLVHSGSELVNSELVNIPSLLTDPHGPVELFLLSARLVQLVDIRDPLDTVTADEDCAKIVERKMNRMTAAYLPQ